MFMFGTGTSHERRWHTSGFFLFPSSSREDDGRSSNSGTLYIDLWRCELRERCVRGYVSGIVYGRLCASVVQRSEMSSRVSSSSMTTTGCVRHTVCTTLFYSEIDRYIMRTVYFSV